MRPTSAFFFTVATVRERLVPAGAAAAAGGGDGSSNEGEGRTPPEEVIKAGCLGRLLVLGGIE